MKKPEKLFCVLESGAPVNEEITLRHKRQFADRPYCDFFRLNWHTEHDPNARWTLKNSQVSENRNFLYDKTRGRYEYYLFIDDDIDFSTSGGPEPAEVIRWNLLEYQPVLAGFFSPMRWRAPPPGDPGDAARCGLVNDMDCMTLSADFADLCFPLPCHGAGLTHDFIFYLALQLCPAKYHIYMNVDARNTRFHGNHENRSIPHANLYPAPEDREQQLDLMLPSHRRKMAEYMDFRLATFSDDGMKEKTSWGLAFNEECEPDKSKHPVSLQEAASVLNIESPGFINRSVLLPDDHPKKLAYLERARKRAANRGW